MVITTKCNHTFHEICFKNFIYTNIIYAECPACNNHILGKRFKKKENFIMSTEQIHTQNNSFSHLNVNETIISTNANFDKFMSNEMVYFS